MVIAISSIWTLEKQKRKINYHPREKVPECRWLSYFPTFSKTKSVCLHLFIFFHKLSTSLKIACNRVGYRITGDFHRLKRCRTSFSTNRIKFVFYLCNFTKKERHTYLYSDLSLMMCYYLRFSYAILYTIFLINYTILW